MNVDRNLRVPDAVQADKRSLELLRVWGANGGQVIAINKAAWDQIEAWGILMADLAFNLSKALGPKFEMSEKECLGVILNAMNVELNNPTD